MDKISKEIMDGFKEKAYKELKVNDEVYINVAHFMKSTSIHKPKYCYCEYGDYEYEKNNDCDYCIHELYNDEKEFVADSSVFNPSTCMKIVDITDNDITLVRADEENDCKVKFTKEEFFKAGEVEWDGFDWKIGF